MTVAATIEIVPTAPPWLLFVRWSRLSIEIDGELSRVRWGTHAFAVAPGEHRVSVGITSSAKATITISILGNETIRLVYTPRLLKHVAGTLEIERLPSAQLRR